MTSSFEYIYCKIRDRRPSQAGDSQGRRSEVGKFSEQDLPALKGKDDLVKEVVAKYGLERGQAQRDVDALLKGRQI